MADLFGTRGDRTTRLSVLLESAGKSQTLLASSTRRWLAEALEAVVQRDADAATIAALAHFLARVLDIVAQQGKGVDAGSPGGLARHVRAQREMPIYIKDVRIALETYELKLIDTPDGPEAMLFKALQQRGPGGLPGAPTTSASRGDRPRGGRPTPQPSPTRPSQIRPPAPQPPAPRPSQTRPPTPRPPVTLAHPPEKDLPGLDDIREFAIEDNADAEPVSGSVTADGPPTFAQKGTLVVDFGSGSGVPPVPPAPPPEIPPPPPPDPRTTRAQPPDPPRSAYARLDCAKRVYLNREFDVTVGLAQKQTPGTTGPPLVRPASSVGPYVMHIQVVADGFTLRAEESWQQDLLVTAEAPYPSVTLHLTAQALVGDAEPSAIQAIFSVDGHTVGAAFRPIIVARRPGVILADDAGEGQASVDISMPTGQIPADLTVQILHSGDIEGRLLWTFLSPIADVVLPSAAVRTNIGSSPDIFARSMREKVRRREGAPDLSYLLRGVGREIADQMPAEFWKALADVAAHLTRAPTVLLLSNEPFVPWELATMEVPLDPKTLPVLGAQASVGRWVFSPPKPRMPPPHEVQVTHMVVVSGAPTGGQTGGATEDTTRDEAALPEADTELDTLYLRYNGQSVEATNKLVHECLDGRPPADVLHFAVHGSFDAKAANVEDGLLLADESFLVPETVKGHTLGRGPFVFLNACRAGAGTVSLNTYSGLAAAFLYAGAAAVVAPLWDVRDDLARDLAMEFYRQTLDGKTTPADALRVSRTLAGPKDAPSATRLAYQFFGHPSLLLRRS